MADFESLNQACIDAVKALGGSKFVGPMLWPEKTPEAAQRLLLDCLNDERPAHLTPDQLMFLSKAAKGKGNHSIAHHFAAECGYSEPQPVEPESELAGLIREFNAHAEKSEAMQAQIVKRLKAMKA